MQVKTEVDLGNRGKLVVLMHQDPGTNLHVVQCALDSKRQWCETYSDFSQAATKFADAVANELRRQGMNQAEWEMSLHAHARRLKPYTKA